MTKDMVFPLKPKYERILRTLGGQEASEPLVDEHQVIHTDEFGKLTITNKYQQDEYEKDVDAAEMTPECRKAKQVAERVQFLNLVDHDPDTLHEATDVPLSSSDDETAPHVHDDGDVVTYERITTRGQDRIPFYTREEWENIPLETRTTMFDDYKRRRRRLKIRGIKKAWLKMDDHQKEAVNAYFERLAQVKKDMMEKDAADARAKALINQNVAATQIDPEHDPEKVDENVAGFLESIESAASHTTTIEPCAVASESETDTPRTRDKRKRHKTKHQQISKPTNNQTRKHEHTTTNHNRPEPNQHTSTPAKQAHGKGDQTNKRTNKQPTEQTNNQPNKQPHKQTNDQTNKRNKQTTKQTTKRTLKPTNKRTTEQANNRPNEHTLKHQKRNTQPNTQTPNQPNNQSTKRINLLTNEEPNNQTKTSV